ncbi:hypothetical protein [Sulfuriroseicoccus oceanibius]|uniref:Uncharacterized protein n=1 Tax=Sulfuriroseicoccus oceanibius TaxID=2707525 RepID=A0A6B3LGI8_9BACT|nr:hypothetical protein [Sulfuriroseicoccus oceanibius]QQL45774.1 hypothetical protein G3M56_004095 [Sulfuriroseicoccus oceanibius]
MPEPPSPADGNQPLAARIWAALPLRLTLVLIALLWVAKENYPFSHFPMYSNFTSYDYVVFVADQDGDPLPLEHVSAGTRTARLKKQFNGSINDVRESLKVDGKPTPRKQDLTSEQKKPAGDEALAWLWNSMQSRNAAMVRLHQREVTELQLYQIGITREKGRIVKSKPEFISSLKIDTHGN